MTAKRNSYTCDTCRQSIVTEDQDTGTTPFMLNCRATKNCTGTMQSSFYRGSLVESGIPARFVWRKPSYKEYVKSSKAMQSHFDQGGLNIYPKDIPQ